MQEWKGMPVVQNLAKQFEKDILLLGQKEITPKLAIVRVGEREDDLSYEKGILKRFQAVNAIAEVTALPSDINQEQLEETICNLNMDEKIHGILLFRPLPRHLSEERIKHIISPEKDVDCMGIHNMAAVFSGDSSGYPPCTPQAVLEILKYYKPNISGKRAVIIGRSMVVGKPLAMLLLAENATVTICHTKTENLSSECQCADILVACAGVPKMVQENFTNPDQVVIDVGIHLNQGKLCGDVDYETVSPCVSAITPVPGGVGTVTTSVLLKHTIQSALRKNIRMDEFL